MRHFDQYLCVWLGLCGEVGRAVVNWALCHQINISVLHLPHCILKGFSLFFFFILTTVAICSFIVGQINKVPGAYQ